MTEENGKNVAISPVAEECQMPDVLDIQPMIKVIRGMQVILDSDLARLYDVETRVLNQAVKRNLYRFPDDFMFQLNSDELKNLISQNVISR